MCQLCTGFSALGSVSSGLKQFPPYISPHPGPEQLGEGVLPAFRAASPSPLLAGKGLDDQSVSINQPLEASGIPVYALESGGSDVLVTQLYIGYFNRAPHPAGLDYWIGQLHAGKSAIAIAGSFAQQAEALDIYTYLSNPLSGSADSFLTAI